jgi:hypothetical protein
MKHVALVLLLMCSAELWAQVETDPARVPEGLVLRVLDRPVAEALDLGVVVFDPGVEADDPSAHAAVRRIESRLLAAQLRDTLIESNAWGAVRVIPAPSAVVAVTITAAIEYSDGRQLQLRVRVEDATGALWWQDTLIDISTTADYPVSVNRDPFEDLYREIANRTLAVTLGYDARALSALKTVTDIRYAQSLVPEAFAGYLATLDGRWQIQRLPARSDPMLARVERIRQQEYLFVDTVDEQFVDLRSEVKPIYDLWRQAGRESADYLAAYTVRAGARAIDEQRGSFASMQQVYSTYRSMKIQEQDLFDIALAFDQEVTPTVLDTGDDVFRFTGTLASQYETWRRLLRQIFELEQGRDTP